MSITEKRILVVDDDPDFAAYLKTILERAGHSVTTAFDGEEALARIRASPPDLVTLDIQMPRKTGVILYRQVKADELLRSIPVIVISGLHHDGDCTPRFIERFFEVDGLPAPERYVDKPVDKARLFVAVNELLAASSA